MVPRSRRRVVFGLFHFAAACFAGRAALGQERPSSGADLGSFDAETVKRRARELAKSAYREPAKVSIPALTKLGSEEYGDIRFRPDHALWHGRADLAFRMQFFHPGHYYLHPVKIFEVADGQVHPVIFSKDSFEYGRNKIDTPLPADLGYAGFRVHFHTDFTRDMVAFLGASYFRAVGAPMQYGISARGIAIDTAVSDKEEFPIFTHFWIERPRPGDTTLTVHALLDGPSVTGAYRFAMRPGRTTLIDVDAAIFPRKAIGRLGLAPLTSMYLHGENDRRVADDFRPEVHDSDGLAILGGKGERLWRPLTNPAKLAVNSYADENPRGFGLLQRDRDFDNYQENGVYYDRRPNLWVEPRGDWGAGAIVLVEIPTEEEIFDNIVAFWSPASKVEANREINVSYRLFWGTVVPDIQSHTARVVATRIGIGGAPGRKRPPQTRKFVIDFGGGPLDLLVTASRVMPIVSASRGQIVVLKSHLVKELNAWRVEFDLKWKGGEPVDLRCYLRLGASAMSETWVYQWVPPT